MNRKRVIKKLKDSMNIYPDDSLFSRIEGRLPESPGSPILVKGGKGMKGKSHKKWITATAVAACAVLILSIGIFSGAIDAITKRADVTVVIDVNPSVEISVNKRDKITYAAALNADGEAVLGDMQLEGAHISVAVNALIGSMLTNGYITSHNNSVLISVSGKDAQRATALEESIMNTVSMRIKENNISGSLMGQVIAGDGAGNAEGVSKGKMALVEAIVSSNASANLNKEDLYKLSITELAILMDERNISADIHKDGEVSKASLIGRDEAIRAALENAALNREDVQRLECELDADDGRIVYEVEFDYGSKEYEYDLNAYTGEIVYSVTKDNKNDDRPSADVITGAEAKNAAFAHLGVKESDVKDLDVELEDNGAYYDVDFEYGAREYEYRIDAATGEVVNVRVEEDDNGSVSNTPATPSASIITREDARAIAIGNARVDASLVKEFRIELDNDDGVFVYEIEFKAGAREYEYEINAVTGKIIDVDVDIDD
ncbi:MAG: hypothetical protein E7315_00100 [Clostridiales bacterium]|nr:hypothetical protein [Clostridiales bacterium]